MSIIHNYKKYFYSLKKRDGRIVEYDKQKIVTIFKEVGKIIDRMDEATATKLADFVEQKLKESKRYAYPWF